MKIRLLFLLSSLTYVFFHNLPEAYGEDYDQQIILNLGSGATAKALTVKRENKYSKSSKTIDLRQAISEDEFSSFNTLTSHSRIYIVGHGSPGTDKIYSDPLPPHNIPMGFHYNDFASLIEKEAPQLKNQADPITISVIACHGADGDLQSFAAKLSQALEAKGIHAQILARLGTVSRWIPGSLAPYKKQVEGDYHQSGSKLKFVTVNGQTEISAVNYPEFETCQTAATPVQNVSNLQNSNQEIVDLIAKKTITFVKTKEQALSLINNILPGNSVYWPSSRMQGKFGYLVKKPLGEVTTLGDALLLDSSGLFDNGFDKNFKVESKEDAAVLLDQLPPKSIVFWPSSRFPGKFGFIRKNLAPQSTSMNDALLYNEEELEKNLN